MNQSSGFVHGDRALPIEMVDESDSLWPRDDHAVLEVRYRGDAVTPEELENIRPVSNVKLMVTASGYRWNWLPKSVEIEVPLSVATFIDRVPRFVRHALRVLQQAHRQVSSPEEVFFFDRDATL
ncbi:hypothetical protein [Georgenia sp. SUBG003]|uniref:hypothetical protein n=1 Tax=Georgenia sp. SUBG003 TaxID=1497974 RepID=UPI003AB783A4